MFGKKKKRVNKTIWLDRKRNNSIQSGFVRPWDMESWYYNNFIPIICFNFLFLIRSKIKREIVKDMKRPKGSRKPLMSLCFIPMCQLSLLFDYLCFCLHACSPLLLLSRLCSTLLRKIYYHLFLTCTTWPTISNCDIHGSLLIRNQLIT